MSDGTGAYQDGSYIPLASPISMARGGTYYISFLVSRFGSATSQAFFGVDLNSGETLPRTSQDLTFGCGSSGYIRTGGDNQGGSLPNTIATSSAYVVAPGATSATAGTYLVVGKIVCAGGSVTTYMSEYASATATVPSAEPTSWEVTSGTTSTSATYTNLQIRKGADMGTNIDEILIGTTYADVTQAQPVPDASSAVATTALALMSLARRRRMN